MNWIVIAIIVVAFAIWVIVAIASSIAKTISTSIDNANKKAIERDNRIKNSAIKGFLSEYDVEYPLQFVNSRAVVSGYPLEKYIQNVQNQIRSIPQPSVVKFEPKERRSDIQLAFNISDVERLHKIQIKNIFTEYDTTVCSYPEMYTFPKMCIKEPEKPFFQTLDYEFPRLKEIHIKGNYSSAIKQALIEKKNEIEEKYEQNLSKHKEVQDSIEKTNLLLKEGHQKAVEYY